MNDKSRLNQLEGRIVDLEKDLRALTTHYRSMRKALSAGDYIQLIGPEKEPWLGPFVNRMSDAENDIRELRSENRNDKVTINISKKDLQRFLAGCPFKED